MSKIILTGKQVAAIFGIARETAYRWANEGRIPPSWNWTPEALAPYAHLRPRPRGPKRNPRSLRYTIGRHNFNEVRGGK